MIELSNISKVFSYGKNGNKQALNNINLTINDGEYIALTGASGAGKTTLFNIIGCIYSASEGRYLLDGIDISGLSVGKTAEIRNKKIGFVQQDYALIDELTVLENVMLPLLFSKESIKEAKRKAVAAIETLGISDILKQPASNLSGGQKQRTAIARAIVNQPSILLADEPTGALDSKNAAGIMEIFSSLNNKGTTVFIVTHDMNIAEQCKRIVRISDGRII